MGRSRLWGKASACGAKPHAERHRLWGKASASEAKPHAERHRLWGGQSLRLCGKASALATAAGGLRIHHYC